MGQWPFDPVAFWVGGLMYRWPFGSVALCIGDLLGWWPYDQWPFGSGLMTGIRMANTHISCSNP